MARLAECRYGAPARTGYYHLLTINMITTSMRMALVASLIIVLAILFAALPAFAQTATSTATSTQSTATSSLMVSVATTPVISAGTNNVKVAEILLDSTRATEGVRLTQIPLSLSTGVGSTLSLNSCSLVNMSGGTGPIATFGAVTGVNTITLATPLVIPAGTRQTLALQCSVPSTATPGTVSVSVTPSAFAGTGATSNNSVTATSGGALSGLVVITNLPNTSGPGTGTGTGSGSPSPGLPNTGAGGTALFNLAILALAGAGLYAGLRARRA